MMNKKALMLVISFTTFVSLTFAQSQKINFIKGNISEKTVAVREASGTEVIWLSNEAIKFALENKDILGNDRELDALAVAGILSIPVEYVKNCIDADKVNISKAFLELFTKFNTSNTVQIAVLSKFLQFKDYIPVTEFTDLLNDYFKSINIKTADSSVVKSVLNAMEYVGNNESFLILYSCYNNPKYLAYKTEIETTISALIPNAMNEVIQIINKKDIKQISQTFALIKQNQKISKNYLSEIAENVLSVTILMVDNSSKISKEIVTLQLEALNILSVNQWTRASSICLAYFELAKKEFETGLISDTDFEEVINSLSNIAPIDSVHPLNVYLEELNRQTENGGKVSPVIVMAVIKTLGAIGDKSAFDSLLAVTYLNYPEEVLSAARGALAGLRW